MMQGIDMVRLCREDLPIDRFRLLQSTRLVVLRGGEKGLLNFRWRHERAYGSVTCSRMKSDGLPPTEILKMCNPLEHTCQGTGCQSGGFRALVHCAS